MGHKTRARNRSRKQTTAFLSDLENRVRNGDITADEAIGIAQGMRDFDAGKVKSIEQIRLDMPRVNLNWTGEELANFHKQASEPQPEPTADLIRIMSRQPEKPQ